VGGLGDNVVGGRRSGSGWEIRGYRGLGAIILAFGGVSTGHFKGRGVDRVRLDDGYLTRL